MQDVFCFAALANTITGTMYTDITGAFPVRSFKSMQYIFVAYVYDLNAIIVRAMPSRTDASMVTAFREVITTLKTGGYCPALNVMDNECSAAVEKYIRSGQINIQLAPRTTIESTLQKGPSQHSKSISLQLSQLWTCTALSNYGMNFSHKLNSP
jgi:metal-sulfur cluster biosynthetic enzyme